MFEVDKHLKAILEGSHNLPTNNDPNPYDDDDSQGGENDLMFAEAVSVLFFAESAIVGQTFNESSFEGITLAQLLREVTEKEIRDDVEAKKSRWQKFKEGVQRFLQSPFDPYGGLKELKAVNELMKDTSSDMIAAGLPFIGIFLMIAQRARKYKNFPEATARQYIDEANKHRAYLNNIAANLEKEDPKKFKKAVKRIRRQIKLLDDWTHEFERRSIDKAII